MAKKTSRKERQELRHRRIRKKISGTTERPRLAVFRTAKHIYAQVIDDLQGKTLSQASTVDKELRGTLKGYTGNKESAQAVGRAVAQRAIKAGITQVVFDRGGCAFHGRVKALAEAAREAGLNL
ncbi:MAG: 50S ribosomal protein L18 [Deltaproteobacteria bacterium]|nr:50S ribosomal protein L18 [Deltaproteobacteria bacterium]